MSGYTGSIADAGRVIHIAKRRERAKEDIELKRLGVMHRNSSACQIWFFLIFFRKKIAAENAVSAITDKFAAHYDAVEQQIKTSTVGEINLLNEYLLA